MKKAEVKIIDKFAEPLSDQEINELIVDAVKKSNATSMKDMGKVMSILKPKLQGRADIGSVSKRIKEFLKININSLCLYLNILSMNF